MSLQKRSRRSIVHGRHSRAIGGIRGRCARRSTRKSYTGYPQQSRRLKEGDILSMDFGVELGGYFGDAALTVPVGKISAEREKLLASDSRVAGARDRQGAAGKSAGGCFGGRAGMGRAERLLGSSRICWARHRHKNARGTADSQLRYGRAKGLGLQEGMVLAIEPMVNVGGPERARCSRISGRQ